VTQLEFSLRRVLNILKVEVTAIVNNLASRLLLWKIDACTHWRTKIIAQSWVAGNSPQDTFFGIDTSGSYVKLLISCCGRQIDKKTRWTGLSRVPWYFFFVFSCCFLWFAMKFITVKYVASTEWHNSIENDALLQKVRSMTYVTIGPLINCFFTSVP